jgi:hypothetical protein
MSYIIVSLLSLGAGAFLWAKYGAFVKTKLQKFIAK